jgi:hypothetical protein
MWKGMLRLIDLLHKRVDFFFEFTNLETKMTFFALGGIFKKMWFSAQNFIHIPF